MVALLFPGQGSQAVGMGKQLADAFPVARRTFQEADDALGVPLSRLMWDGPEDELTATLNAQPALLVHSVAVLRVVEDKLGTVAYAAGHSLGEFSAHVAAGTIDFADAVRAVRKRGELMFQSGSERPGTMAAVLGVDDDVIQRVCAEVSAAGDGVVVPANFNSPGQVVVSGDVAAIDRAMDALKAAGAKRVLKLNVSGAFHSPLMEVAKTGLREHLAAIDFHAPRFPVVSNVTAEPVDDTEVARRLLVEQLTSPVRWTASMQKLIELGVTRFVELGNGNVLAGLLKRIDRAARAQSIANPDDLAALDAA